MLCHWSPVPISPSFFTFSLFLFFFSSIQSISKGKASQLFWGLPAQELPRHSQAAYIREIGWKVGRDEIANLNQTLPQSVVAVLPPWLPVFSYFNWPGYLEMIKGKTMPCSQTGDHGGTFWLLLSSSSRSVRQLKPAATFMAGHATFLERESGFPLHVE